MFIGPSSRPLMCLRSQKADIHFHVFEENFCPRLRLLPESSCLGRINGDLNDHLLSRSQ